MVLDEKQKTRIQTSFKSGNFNLDLEVEILTRQGFSREEAIIQIQPVVKAFRQKLFDQKIKAEDNEGLEKASRFLVIMIGLIGPIFNITSLIWYGFACVMVAGTGYWSYKKTPVAGLFGCICFILMFPIAYNWYLSERKSIFKIEIIIPIGFALLASYFVGLLIANFLYSKKTN
jgi:hypothetical protein